MANNISSYIIIAISYIKGLNCLCKKQIIFNFALQPDNNEEIFDYIHLYRLGTRCVG